MRFLQIKSILSLLAICLLGGMTMESSAQCTASFSYSISGGVVSFTSSSTPTNANHYWSFGNGASAYSKNPSNTYSSNGTYTVCLTVFDSSRQCLDTACATVSISGISTPCKASFTSSARGLTASFNNQSTGNNSSYQWSFGDGSTSTATSPSHTYASSGAYTICLYALDSGTICDSVCDSIYVSGPSGGGCNAYFTSSSQGFTAFFNNQTTGNATSYEWSFGDGTTSTSSSPAHNYSSAGTYWVCLLALDSGMACDTFCDSIVIKKPASNCKALFYAMPNGLSVYFANRSYGNGTGLSYSWDFGDGSTSSSFGPTHTYSSAGTYIVCLAIADSGNNCTDTICDSVVVAKKPKKCKASFNTKENGLSVTFDNKSTGSNATYLWKFGDGNTSSSTNPTHTYGSAGTYTVCLYVLDSGVICDSICKQVKLKAPKKCKAKFVLYPDSATKYLILVQDQSTGNNLSYNWNFGDGTTSSSATPTHAYSSFGTYVLCLTVTDSNCTDTYCDTFSLDSSGNFSTKRGFTLRVIGDPVSVKETPKTVELDVFPNPFHDEFIIETGNGEIGSYKVMDLTGKERLVSATSNGTSTLKIDSSNLPAGIYILQVSVNNQMESRRLIKH